MALHVQDCNELTQQHKLSKLKFRDWEPNHTVEFLSREPRPQLAFPATIFGNAVFDNAMGPFKPTTTATAIATTATTIDQFLGGKRKDSLSLFAHHMHYDLLSYF